MLIYFYGGGYQAGDGSEPRYDGEAIARKGVVTVTANYRPGHLRVLRASRAEQGILEACLRELRPARSEARAIRWILRQRHGVRRRPRKITIAGESAGSISVSALMASPLSRGLIAGAIGSSGSMMGTLPAVALAEGEREWRQVRGHGWGEVAGGAARHAGRRPAGNVAKTGTPRFSPTIDGYFLPKSPLEIFAAGEQAHVPLLIGWNSEEQNWRSVIRTGDPAPANMPKPCRNSMARAPPSPEAVPGFDGGQGRVRRRPWPAHGLPRSVRGNRPKCGPRPAEQALRVPRYLLLPSPGRRYGRNGRRGGGHGGGGRKGRRGRAAQGRRARGRPLRRYRIRHGQPRHRTRCTHEHPEPSTKSPISSRPTTPTS